MEYCKKKIVGIIINMWNYVCSLPSKLIRKWKKKGQEVQTTKDNKKRPANKFHRKKERLPQLSISQLEKLKTLFVQKQWPIVEDEGLSVFERFYQTLLLLDNDEQDFLIKLTYRFEHIPLSEYLNYMVEPLKRLRQDAGKKNLMFVTCTPKADVGAVKSSSAVLYQLKGTTMKQHLQLHPKIVIENIQKLPDYSITDSSIVVLVDDFIGTGETALAAVDYIHELVPALKDNSQIVVFSIIALHKGIECLNNIGVKIYCSIEKRKAISEEMTGNDRVEATAIMQKIESKLKKLNEDFRFGYKGSEALVSMERCPNNTFPVYWLTKNIAPYER